MQFEIETLGVYGQVVSIVASGNPFRTELEVKPSGLLNYPSDKFIKDLDRAKKLASCKTGEGHDNFLRGILVEFNVTAPLYWWKQAQRYTWFNFISSQSTMHCLLKFNIKDQCVEETDPRIIEILESMNKSKLRELTELGTGTIAKLSKCEPVGLEVLAKICYALNCKIEDVVEFVYERN